MVEFFIETSIDKLIGMIREKKRLKLSVASKILKVSQKKLDDWVFMLEDKGIVDLKYPVLGEPEIVLKKNIAEEVLKPRKKIEVENRIIPGKPIKKENLPVFKPSSLPDSSSERESKAPADYGNLVDELKSLENRISQMTSRRAENDPNNLYITEKLRFLEGKLNELSNRNEKGGELRETDKMILEKLEMIENRISDMSKKVNKEEASNHLKKGKKEVKLEGTDNV
ncbi:MAG: hypothetical protein V1818_02070 [Candidatus Aenigmatarchaeota archaeon]